MRILGIHIFVTQDRAGVRRERAFHVARGRGEAGSQYDQRLSGETSAEAFEEDIQPGGVLLAEQGVLNLREVTLDGTKIEANANRYTFVRGKAINVSREWPDKPAH